MVNIWIMKMTMNVKIAVYRVVKLVKILKINVKPVENLYICKEVINVLMIVPHLENIILIKIKME